MDYVFFSPYHLHFFVQDTLVKICMRFVLALVSGRLLCVAVLLGLVNQPLVWSATALSVPAVNKAAFEMLVRLPAERRYPLSFDQRENPEAAADYTHATLRKQGTLCTTSGLRWTACVRRGRIAGTGRLLGKIRQKTCGSGCIHPRRAPHFKTEKWEARPMPNF